MGYDAGLERGAEKEAVRRQRAASDESLDLMASASSVKQRSNAKPERSLAISQHPRTSPDDGASPKVLLCEIPCGVDA